jgi:hypothetical protein
MPPNPVNVKRGVQNGEGAADFPAPAGLAQPRSGWARIPPQARRCYGSLSSGAFGLAGGP